MTPISCDLQDLRALRLARSAALALVCATAAAQDAAPQPTMFIREFRVLGATELPRIAVEETVYPFLGPGRTFDDVERARAALEKAYRDKGFSIAQVMIPEQTGGGGIVNLQVLVGKVGSLHVKNARFFRPSLVRKQAQSLAEGKVVNFNAVTRDIVALNQHPDRRVQPKLEPGAEPGQWDIELLVDDKSPFHGSVELNNRNSANTTDLRLNTSFSYANLWQRGHSIGASYQTSPGDLSEVKVFSGYYIARFAGVDDFSLMLTGTKQDSNVSTLGGVAVAGKGEILGARGIFTLPSQEGFFHSLSLGLDYKHFDQAVQIGITTDVTPISYYPLSATWDGTWLHSREEPAATATDPEGARKVELGTTTLSAGVTFGLRGTGSTRTSLDRNRFGADGNFIYLRGDISHTQKLWNDWELFAKVQGQASDQPLVNSEQFGGGGMGTVRGYLEAEVLGDNAILGTVELRTSSLLKPKRVVGEGREAREEATGNEWRFYAFADGGSLTLHDTLPEQASSFRLASIGLGTELQLRKHFHGILEVSLPLTTQSATEAHDPRVSFRLWADF
jgi:hemolysin activation/secretion protein